MAIEHWSQGPMTHGRARPNPNGAWVLFTDHQAALSAVTAERDRLREALAGCFCPRPANGRPDQFTVGECVAAGECGCADGLPLRERNEPR